MKIFEEYLKKGVNKDFFVCEVSLKYTKKTKEVERLIEEINTAHERVFDDDYKTMVVVESDNARFETVLEG